MKKITALIMMILFTLGGTFAQVGEIKGIVKDKKTGEPIFGATVYIETGGTKTGAAADPDGKYTIKAVNAGEHTVYVSALGYENIQVVNVAVSTDKITYVNADLEDGAITIGTFTKIEYIEPLISKDEPGVQHIPMQQFKNSVNGRRNPLQAIADMSNGVTVGSDGKSVMIRGSRPASTQFITDGIKSITGDIGIPGQAVGGVKVYTSGIPARYGDVSGGVIVVETKSYFDLAQEYK